MTNKERYRQFCKTQKDIPVFSQAFWLDAVAEHWDVCLVSADETIIAALPYCWKGNLLTKRIYLPDLSFYQSVLFFNVDDKNQQQKLSEALFAQLPKTIKSYFKFLPVYTAIQLSSLKYTKEEYATFIIKDKAGIQLSTNHKRNVQKGIKHSYTITESKNIDASFEILISTFNRQQLKSKLSLSDFKKINKLVKKHDAGKIVDCMDKQHNLLASASIVADEKTVYYLFGGYNSAFKNSGAMTFLLHEAIQTAIEQQKQFNFCGSSKKSIATFFEGFGATKTIVPIWKKSIL